MEESAKPPWPLWQRLLFRFFFVYWTLEVSPWDWLRFIPGASYLFNPIGAAERSIVEFANANFWHVQDKLIMPNGSGDTSYGWAYQWTITAAAFIGMVVWSAIDRKRERYDRALYWLRSFVRFWLAVVALSYGTIKLYALQMPFPTLSNLSTPLGDLLGMRLSWLFLGYSFSYQFFGGFMETISGVLLLWRRTILAGVFAATGAFTNVVMLNWAYDVPVKIFSSNLLLGCLFLLALDSQRLVNLLLLNRTVHPTLAWEPNWTKSWHRWLAIATKLYFVWFFVWTPFKSARTRYLTLQRPPVQGPFKTGVYEVTKFALNGKDVPITRGDSLRWKDVIFDSPAAGSANTMDTMFWTRYRRGYFRYKPDTVAKTVTVWRTSFVPGDSVLAFVAKYETPDSLTIRWRMKIRNDSAQVDMLRVPRHFQLAERSVHWLSEYNR
jgi:hypothetical protein